MSKVRYRVLKTVFVNGSLAEPVKGRDVIVEAAAGLEGPALELIKDEAPKGRAPGAGSAPEGARKAP